MNDLDRMRKLAGILTESVSMVPGLGEKIELGDETADEPGWFIVRADGTIGAGPYASEGEARNDIRSLQWFDSSAGDDFAFGHDVDGKFVYDDSGEEAEDISGIDGENLGSGGMDEFELNNTNDPLDVDDPAPMEEVDAFASDDVYEDLNNGYDDIKFMNPGDFFPDGADSPVAGNVGPSGARQGDNPEQKKMQVAETHKELVYNYRKFLKESSKN